MTADLIQISYSDLSAFHQCPRRYYYEKRLRMGALPNVRPSAVKRGTLMHTLLEGARDGCIDERQARALFAREQLSDKSQQDAILQAAQRVLASEVYAQISAGCDLRRERQFYLPLRSTAPQPSTGASAPSRQGKKQRSRDAAIQASEPTRYLKGFIDIQSTRDDGSLLILDYKSGTRADASATDYEDQARCYALVGLADGHDSVTVCFIRPEVDVPEEPSVPSESASASASPASGAPQVFTLGPYTRKDYASIEASLVAAIHAMEQTGPDSPCAGDIIACANCPLPPSACPRRSAE